MVRFEQDVVDALAEQIIIAAIQARNAEGLRIVMPSAAPGHSAPQKAAMLALHFMVMEGTGTPFNMAGLLGEFHK